MELSPRPINRVAEDLGLAVGVDLVDAHAGERAAQADRPEQPGAPGRAGGQGQRNGAEESFFRRFRMAIIPE